MQLPEPFRFVDEGLPFGFAEGLPAGAQIFADDGVVHVRRYLADLAPLDLAPHHERVHRAFDVARAVFFRLCCIGVGCARIFVHHLGPEQHRWDQLLLLLLYHGDRLTVYKCRLLLLQHCGVNEQRSQRDSGIVGNLNLHRTGIHHLGTTLGHYQMQVVIVLGYHNFNFFRCT